MPETQLICTQCGAPCLPAEASWRCSACDALYRTLLGIPDMRVPTRAWIDFEQDWALAEKLAANYHRCTFAELVQMVWSERANIPPPILQRRLHGIESESRKHQDELAPGGWLGQLRLAQPVLELGCGTGGFLVPLSGSIAAAGVDISMAWLITAKKRLEQAGRQASLVCACAENLPFAAGTFATVAAFDVLEHLDAIPPAAQEIARITRPGGRLIATTPNRFSLTAEPHVGLWGVGLLPRSQMSRYVQWRNGMAYKNTYPQSARDLRRKLAPWFQTRFLAPEIWSGDIARFPPAKAQLARWYNKLPGRGLLRPISPFFQIVATRLDHPAAR